MRQVPQQQLRKQKRKKYQIPPPPKAPQIKEEPPILVEDETEEPVDEPKDPPPVIQPDPPSLIGDLLGLDEINPVAAELEETNALPLAIVPSGENSKPNTAGFLDGFSETSELALVTAESGNTRHFTESTLAGGFDKLLLDSLYEDTAMRQQMSTTNYGNDAATSNNPMTRLHVKWAKCHCSSNQCTDVHDDTRTTEHDDAITAISAYFRPIIRPHPLIQTITHYLEIK